MNKEALDKIIKAGLLLGCEIAPECKWDRKNYFYPDSPKNYQISQYDQPLCRGGFVEIELPGPARNVMGEHKRIALTRIHLEEDVGKLNHGEGVSLVDFNRAGTPLMEIVSEPAIHSADEAFAYLTALKTVMIYGGISDCDMEKGQLRCDANISIRPAGSAALGTKVELKNLNSFSFVRDGIAQRDQAPDRGRRGRRDGRAGDPRLRRPDGRVKIPEVKGDGARLPLFPRSRPHAGQGGRRMEVGHARPLPRASVRQAAPAPEGLRRSVHDHVRPRARPRSSATSSRRRRACAASPKAAGNWIANDLLRELGSARLALAQSKVRPAHVAGLVKLVETGAILSNAAKEVFIDMFQTGDPPDRVVARKGLEADAGAGELERWCSEAIAANPKSAADFRAGKESAINAFKGPVMRAAKGKADPKRVDEILRRLLAG